MIFPGARPLPGCLLVPLAAVITAMSSAGMANSEPLYVKNLSPVTGLIGLPSQRVAATQEAGSFGFALHTSIANNYVSDVNATEGLNLDGETLRFAFETRYGLAPDWDIQLEIPWLDHSGGQFDNLIDGWHDLWGMTDGGRSKVPQDLLDHRYGGPKSNFALLDDTSGLGDITFSLTHAFYRDIESAASISLGYKIATGEEDDFLGSGGDDVYLALRFSGGHLSGLPLSWHGQLGYLHAGGSDALGAAGESDLWFAGLAVDWAVADTVSLIAQLDMHAAPLDSELTAIGDEAVMVSLGARWRFARRWTVDFNFIEDARVETAPDITFQASLRFH